MPIGDPPYQRGGYVPPPQPVHVVFDFTERDALRARVEELEAALRSVIDTYDAWSNHDHTTGPRPSMEWMHEDRRLFMVHSDAWQAARELLRASQQTEGSE